MGTLLPHICLIPVLFCLIYICCIPAFSHLTCAISLSSLILKVPVSLSSLVTSMSSPTLHLAHPCLQTIFVTCLSSYKLHLSHSSFLLPDTFTFLSSAASHYTSHLSYPFSYLTSVTSFSTLSITSARLFSRRAPKAI